MNKNQLPTATQLWVTIARMVKIMSKVSWLYCANKTFFSYSLENSNKDGIKMDIKIYRIIILNELLILSEK